MRPHPWRVESRAPGDPGMGNTDHTIWMNRRMWAAWEVTIERLGFTPTIVQGAYMAGHGGGAEASAGYHDFGGCIDTSIIGMSDDTIKEVLRVGRRVGWAVWHRIVSLDGLTGGDHMHWCLLDDERAAGGALGQMVAYRRNPTEKGLATIAIDRDAKLTPRPVVVFDYDEFLKEEDDMNLSDPIKGQKEGEDPVTVADALRAIIKLQGDFGNFQEREKQRNKQLRARIAAAKEVLEDLPTDDQLKSRVKTILDSIQEDSEDDVDEVPVG